MIKNRNGIALSVLVEGENNTRGLAFIVHGLAGFKEQRHIRAMAETFLGANYTVVTYDAAHTIGESGGMLLHVTLTGYSEDLEDVISWASKQSWYKAPAVLAGHSLGAACSIMYAAKYPSQVKAIAPISAFIAGTLYRDILPESVVREWQRRTYFEEESHSKPGTMKRIGWQFFEDALRYDMRDFAPRIICPVLLVVGSADTGTPLQQQQLFADNLQTPHELHVIEGMGHNPYSSQHIDELRHILADWLESLPPNS